jgi:predicted MFS family arabinose efflux permease
MNKSCYEAYDMQKTITAPSPSEKILPYAWVILVVIYLASVVAPMNQFKVPPLIPVLMETIHINLTQAGLLMSSIAAVGLILALPAGLILQRFGPKLTVLAAMAALAVGSALGAVSTTFTILLAGRVLEGVGFGLIGVAAPATIAMWFPPSKQGTPMGIWATWVPMGSILMYNMAPMLATLYGWQSVWWVGMVFALLMAVFSGLLLRRPPIKPIVLPPDPSQRASWKALANRDIWFLAACFACFNLALVNIATYYPTFLNEVRGITLSQASFITSIPALLVMVASPLSGWFSDRINSRRLVFTLPYLVLAVILIFPFQVSGWQINALMVVYGFVIGLIPTAVFAAAPEIMRRPELAGLGLAAILVGQNFGQLVGPVLFGALVKTLGWTPAGFLLIPICLLGFLCGWMVRVR